MAREAILYIATKLGGLRDEIVIVGGLVPSLIVPQTKETNRHVGTMDVDLGLAMALLDGQRYRELPERLRSAGFEPDVNESNNRTNQRWKFQSNRRSVTADFLVPATSELNKGGTLRNLAGDFAAIITPGLELAFEDRMQTTIEGRTLHDERASREVWVCGPGAFVALKAIAFRNRGENKDAYDLDYML